MERLPTSRSELLSQLVAKEWCMFSAVHDLQGKASCQSDPVTFVIMRLSQFQSWNDTTLYSYFCDLVTAEAQGVNLMTYKYAYMMKTTFPQEYKHLEKALPYVGLSNSLVIKRILKLQLNWLRELLQARPNLSIRLRYVTEAEATPGATSFETYARGELMTYSLPTLKALLAYLTKLQAEGRNQIEEILTYSSNFYGYNKLETI